MKVELFAHNRWSGRYRAALVFEGGRAIPGLSAAESKRLLGAAGDEGFGGRFKQVCVVRTGRGRQRMVLVGLGRRQDFEPDRVRAAVALTVNLSALTALFLWKAAKKISAPVEKEEEKMNERILKELRKIDRKLTILIIIELAKLSLTSKEIADILGIDDSTVRKLLPMRKLRGVKK